MKHLHRFLLVSATFAASASIALADVPAVSLEYSGSSRVDGTTKPVATFKSYSSIEKERIRRLTKFVVTPNMPIATNKPAKSPLSMLGHIGAFKAGGIGVMIDRENNKFMAFSEEAKSYFEQPYDDFLQQIRFDPFSKVAPELSKEAPPELTEEQRKRLGAEINVAAKAFLKDNFKVYFRALPGNRNFPALDGVATHGYRMTLLFNTAKPSQPARWGKVASEWWVADSLPGDDMIRDFTGGMFDDIQRMGGISTSMWINEALPVMWQSLPQEIRDAAATYIPLPPADDAWFKGTLAYLAVTADMRNAKSPHPILTRTEMTLEKRSTADIPGHVFLPPAGYQKQDISLLLALYKGLSASILDPNGPLTKMMKSGKMPVKMPFAQTMPLLSSLQPVIDSPFASHFKEAVQPNW